MKRRILCTILSVLLMLGLFPSAALASAEWPGDVSIASDAGIIMDARSGAVVYGKNIHSTFSPASITKVLTALIILENCAPEEMVTFSQNAVYNVEADSTSAGYDTGDQATVRDCLYAALLKSANEAANALAEHLSGSTEEFAVMMNAKAAELGCQDSNFTNPSGLNDENHYVSAYDMALITRAAFNNKMFSNIVSTTYYNLPPNKRNPQGQGISPGNRMVKPNWPDQYRCDVIGGKTGYTSIALNTLVICARQNDTKFVTVILHSRATHYQDTKKLLDFGFRSFESVRIADYDTTYSSVGDDLEILGLPTSDNPILTVDGDSWVTLPKTADFTEASATLDYTLPADSPAQAIACINYALGDRPIGRAYLTMTDPLTHTDMVLPQTLLEVKPSAIAGISHDTDTASVSGNPKTAAAEGTVVPAPSESKPENSRLKLSLKIPAGFLQVFIGVLAVCAVVGGTAFYLINRQRKEERERQLRRQRRAERLKETNISEADFDLMIQGRRANASVKSSSKKRFRHVR